MNLANFECDICSKCFKKLQHIKQHKKRVHEEKTRKFICDYCSQSFYAKDALKKHNERVHEGHKNFKCEEEECTKAFWDEKSLISHIRRVHENEEPEKNHKCESCDKKFAKPDNLKRHLKRQSIYVSATIWNCWISARGAIKLHPFSTRAERSEARVPKGCNFIAPLALIQQFHIIVSLTLVLIFPSQK